MSVCGGGHVWVYVELYFPRLGAFMMCVETSQPTLSASTVYTELQTRLKDRNDFNCDVMTLQNAAKCHITHVGAEHGRAPGPVKSHTVPS